MTAAPRATLALVPLLTLLAATSASAACDPSGADAAPLLDARAAIDATCPCAQATTRGTHVACATDVVRARILAAQLRPECRRTALQHAKLSVCGRPGSAVCCRVTGGGREKHKVVSDPAKCVSTTRVTACVSTWPSVPTGCDATGCIPPEPSVCGNGVVEPGEDCEPPATPTCDITCHAIVCSFVPSACGNGTIDPGEACEPAAAGSCDSYCQPAPCAPAMAGEIDVACPTEATSTQVAAGARDDAYLLSWSARLRGSPGHILARRYDVDATPVDPAVRILTDTATCHAWYQTPSVGSDGDDWYVAWSGYGSGMVPGTGPFGLVAGRRVRDAGADPIDQLAFAVPVGQCTSTVTGPTAVAGTGPAAFAASWRVLAGCFNGPLFENPDGALLDFGAGAPPAIAGLALGFPIVPPPAAYSASGATLGSLGADTLAAWHAAATPEAVPPFTIQPFVAAAWIGPGSAVSSFVLSARRLNFWGRPAVAAGATSLLVAWAESPNDAVTAATEIRGVRVTRLDGRLDADGGALLATTGGAVRGGPVAAFDGSVWLVAWVEEAGIGAELRAVAVQADGTVLDATPRLLATDVATADPAAASAGDGRVLVVFQREDVGATAVRAVLVPGS